MTCLRGEFARRHFQVFTHNGVKSECCVNLQHDYYSSDGVVGDRRCTLRLLVMRAWQLAQRTSHLAISAKIVSAQHPLATAWDTLKRLCPRTWSNCSTSGSDSGLRKDE